MRAPPAVQAYVQSEIQALNYDFTRFSVKDFVEHIERRHKKRIYLFSYPLADALFGLWIPSDLGHIVVVNANTHPIHQAHIIIHEVGHILFNHPVDPLNQVLPPELLKVLGVIEAYGCVRYANRAAITRTQRELEAETFAFQVQDHIIRAKRLHELTQVGSSIESVLPLLQAITY